MLDPRADFTFVPSLIWLPFGIRTAGDVTFPLEPMYARKGIRFVNRAAVRIDPVARPVTTGDGEEIEYDRLLIATGPRLAFEKIPGLGPDGGHTQSVCNLDHALLAGEAWEAFLEIPGPVVVGTAQGGSCFGASYEFRFNIKHRIKKAGLEDVAPVTFITAEPYLGHFGLGGVGDSSQRVELFFDRLGLEGLPNSATNEVRDGEIELESGRTLPFAYSMIVPPFTGVDAVRRVDGLGNAAGFIPVDDEFRHPEYEEIYSAGVAIAIAPREPTAAPAGVPKTGQMSETMAKVAAHNIAADLRGGRRKRLPLSELAAMYSTPRAILADATWGTIMRMQLAPEVRTVGELEVLAQIEAGLPLIDTRLPKYLAYGTLPSARAIPHTQIAGRLGEYDPTTDTILFCNGPQCAATPDAIRRLHDAGRPPERLLYYRGGIHDWVNARASARAGELSPRAVSTRPRWEIR